MKHFLLLTLMAISSAAMAQTTKGCVCCSESHVDFDFWLGSWEVKDTAGVVVGHNKIEKLEGGCLVSEQWTGAKTSTGRSYNYYDPSDKLWHQHWIDNSGLILDLSGGKSGETMVLTSEELKGQNIPFYRHQISWQPKEDGTVVQTWNMLGPDGEVLQVLFIGIYHPKS